MQVGMGKYYVTNHALRINQSIYPIDNIRMAQKTPSSLQFRTLIVRDN